MPRTIRPLHWTEPSTTPDPVAEGRTVRVTHPFHPWSGREFVLVWVQQTWQQDRVFFFGVDGTRKTLSTERTDVGERDVFVTLACGVQLRRLLRLRPFDCPRLDP